MLNTTRARVTLTRGTDTRIVVLRQLPHDTPAIVGQYLKHGSRLWLIVAVEKGI